MKFPWNDRLPMHSPATLVLGGMLLGTAKILSVWVVAQACASAGTDPVRGAAVAAMALAPSAFLEGLALWCGYGLARRYMAGPSLDRTVQAKARQLGAILYLCFLTSGIGLLAAGWILDLGMAVAAPVLAPLAPVAVAAGALRLLASSVRRGAEFEDDVSATI